MDDDGVVLKVDEVIGLTYRFLGMRNDSPQLKLSDRIRTEVAFESNHIGEMEYDDFTFVEFAGHNWVLGLGKYCKGVTKPYSSDILAFEYSFGSKDLESDEVFWNLAGKIVNGSYFRNSLFVGLSDGRIFVPPRSIFYEKVSKNLGLKVNNYLANGDSSKVSALTFCDLSPYSGTEIKYLSYFANVLSDVAVGVLGE